MIGELGVAVLLSLPGQGTPTFVERQLETQKIQQKMFSDTVEKIKKEEALSSEIATKTKEIEKAVAETAAAIEELKSYFVEPAKYSPTSKVNAYVWGNCTWYVKTQRPDIGGFWGNARNWATSAMREGFSVGKEPKIGAIGVSYEGWWGHVFVVTGMNKARTMITISEMNYAGGVGVVHTRTIPASGYDYIYNLV